MSLRKLLVPGCLLAATLLVVLLPLHGEVTYVFSATDAKRCELREIGLQPLYSSIRNRRSQNSRGENNYGSRAVRIYDVPVSDPFYSSLGYTSGTGYILADGFALTNYHVVERMILPTMSDGKNTYPATVIAKDSDKDIALLMYAPPSNMGFKTTIRENVKPNESDN